MSLIGSAPSRVLVVGGPPGPRDSLALVLDGDPRLHVVGATGSLDQVPAIIAAAEPEIVLVDWPSSDSRAMLTIRAARHACPGLRIGHLITRATSQALLCSAFAKGDRLLLKVLDPTATAEAVLALKRDSGAARSLGVRAILEWYDAWSAASGERFAEDDGRFLRQLLGDMTDREVSQGMGIDEDAVREEIVRLYLQMYYEPAFARSTAALMQAMNRLASPDGT